MGGHGEEEIAEFSEGLRDDDILPVADTLGRGGRTVLPRLCQLGNFGLGRAKSSLAEKAGRQLRGIKMDVRLGGRIRMKERKRPEKGQKSLSLLLHLPTTRSSR